MEPTICSHPVYVYVWSHSSKSAKGDEPQDTLWQGVSGNKMSDTYNTERFTILKSKFIKMRAPNMAIEAQGGTSQTTD